MAQYTGNFETGVNGNNILTTDPGSANAWNDRYDGFGDVTVKYASSPAYGALSAEIVIAATPNYGWVAWDSSTLGSLTELWGRVYLRLSSLPGAKGYFVKGNITAGDALAWGITISTDGLIRLVDKDGNNIAAGAIPVNVGAWFRIEFHVINSATVGQIEAKLFNNADSNNATETITSAASFNLQTTTQKIRFGQSENAFANCTINLDNILVNDTGYPGPLPPRVTANFETGVQGALPLPADAGSGTPWNERNQPGIGSLVYDNTHAYGRMAAKIITPGTGSSLNVAWTTALGSPTDHYGRVYMYLPSVPTDDVRFITAIGFRIDIKADGLIRLLRTAGFFVADSAVRYPTNQWFRLEWHVVHSTTTGVVEARMFNSPDSAIVTDSFGGTGDTGTSCDALYFGDAGGNAAVATIWFDNIVAGAFYWVGPVDGTPQSGVSLEGVGLGRW